MLISADVCAFGFCGSNMYGIGGYLFKPVRVISAFTKGISTLVFYFFKCAVVKVSCLKRASSPAPPYRLISILPVATLRLKSCSIHAQESAVFVCSVRRSPLLYIPLFSRINMPTALLNEAVTAFISMQPYRRSLRNPRPRRALFTPAALSGRSFCCLRRRHHKADVFVLVPGRVLYAGRFCRSRPALCRLHTVPPSAYSADAASQPSRVPAKHRGFLFSRPSPHGLMSYPPLPAVAAQDICFLHVFLPAGRGTDRPRARPLFILSAPPDRPTAASGHTPVNRVVAPAGKMETAPPPSPGTCPPCGNHLHPFSPSLPGTGMRPDTFPPSTCCVPAELPPAADFLPRTFRPPFGPRTDDFYTRHPHAPYSASPTTHPTREHFMPGLSICCECVNYRTQFFKNKIVKGRKIPLLCKKRDI